MNVPPPSASLCFASSPGSSSPAYSQTHSFFKTPLWQLLPAPYPSYSQPAAVPIIILYICTRCIMNSCHPLLTCNLLCVHEHTVTGTPYMYCVNTYTLAASHFNSKLSLLTEDMKSWTCLAAILPSVVSDCDSESNTYALQLLSNSVLQSTS